MWSYQALIVLVILIPGFLTRLIVAYATPRKSVGDLQAAIESLVLSLFIYASAFLFAPGMLNDVVKQIVQPDYTKFLKDISPLVLYSMVAVVVLSLLLTLNSEYDLLLRGLRMVRLTKSSGRSSTWLDVFSEMDGRPVIVTLEDGRRILGFPQIISPDEEEGIIFLRGPSWIDNSAAVIPMQIRGIMILKNKVKLVEFLNSKVEEKVS